MLERYLEQLSKNIIIREFSRGSSENADQNNTQTMALINNAIGTNSHRLCGSDRWRLSPGDRRFIIEMAGNNSYKVDHRSTHKRNFEWNICAMWPTNGTRNRQRNTIHCRAISTIHSIEWCCSCSFRSNSYNQMANGLAERFVDTYKRSLVKRGEDVDIKFANILTRLSFHIHNANIFLFYTS